MVSLARTVRYQKMTFLPSVMLLFTSVVLAIISLTDAGSTCMGLIQFTSYETQTTFDGATGACGRSGGSLVRIHNSEAATKMNEIITQSLYYIGLKWQNGRWSWIDGNSFDYSNWEPGEPGGSGQHCVVANGANQGKWKDVSCNSPYRYVCRKTIALTISTPSALLQTVSANGPNGINCEASVTGSCSGKTVAVTWYGPNSGSSSVVTSQSAAVYQVKETGSTSESSYLALTKISQAKRFICKATFATLEEEEHIAVTVRGAPVISEIYRTECSSNLTVSWKPDKRAVGFSHKIKIFPTADETKFEQFDVRVTSLSQSKKIFSGLVPSTKYTIRIFTCNAHECNDVDAAEEVATTGGIPQLVDSVKILQYAGVCFLTWSKPAVVGDEISRYTVTIEDGWYKSREKDANITYTEFSNLTNKFFAFGIAPNRQYKLQVRAATCAGPGKPVNGSCTGYPKGPEKVGRPTVSQNNIETNITVQIPDETKGLISCLFVVIASNMTLGNESDSPLSKYAHQKVPDFFNTSLNNEYVTIAIPPSRFAHKKSAQFTLGDNSSSYCNISDADIGEKETLRPDNKTVWIGENRPLRRDIQHKVYVLAVAPQRGGYAWKKSEQEIIRTAQEATTWVQYKTEFTTTIESTSEKQEFTTEIVTKTTPVSIESFYFDPSTFGITLAIPAMLVVGFVAWKIFKNCRSENLGEVTQPRPQGTSIYHSYEDIEDNDASNQTGTENHQKHLYEETGYSNNPYAEISNGDRSTPGLQSSAYEVSQI